MKIFPLFFLIVFLIAGNACADDIDCVRNNCLGTCITKEEALHKIMPMICMAQYSCYQDAECLKLENGKCGWKETPQLKACIAEKTKAAPPALPSR